MYTRVESRFWADERMRAVSQEARYLMLYLLTNPHRNMLGLYYLPAVYACYDLGWHEKRFRERFGELLQTGVIHYDEQTSVLWITNFLRHNPIANPNQIKRAIGVLDEIPKTALYEPFYEHLKRFAKPLHEPFLERLEERFIQPFRNKNKNKIKIKIKDSVSETVSKPIEKEPPGRTPEGLPANGAVKVEAKVRYAEFVRITPAQYQKLVDNYGEAGAKRMIEILDNYKGAKGRTYKDDYRAILNWVVGRYLEEEAKKPRSGCTRREISLDPCGCRAGLVKRSDGMYCTRCGALQVRYE